MSEPSLTEWYSVHSDYCHPALGLYCLREGCWDDLIRRGWDLPDRTADFGSYQHPGADQT